MSTHLLVGFAAPILIHPSKVELVLRRIRRPAALIAPLLLLSALATACGSQTGVETGSLEGDAAYTLSGDVGTTPDVAWKGRMKAGEAKTDVVVTGDGAKLAAKDEVLVNYYVASGFTQKTAMDTYTPELAPLDLTIGGEVPAPTSQTPTPEEISRYLLDTFVASQVAEGDTVGTRKTVTVSSADILGTSGANLDIGNDEGVLVVIDIDSTVLKHPEGEIQARAATLPTITTAGGSPGGLGFARTPAPDGKLHVSTLIQGAGPAVKTDDLIKVNYLGQVYDAAKPFDESYTKTPIPVVIGQGGVVKGWDQGLVGVPVGSRVLLEVPPSLGYAQAPPADSGIPKGATLFFVVDVLAAG